MKVLFLTNIPSPYRVGFFNELGKLCALTVLYERKQASNRNAKWQSHKAKYFKEVFLKGIPTGNDSALCFSILKYLNGNQYDIIIVGEYGSPTGMLAIKYLRYKNIPFILNSDGGIIKNDKGFKHIIKEYFISKASAWLSTGKKTNEYLLHYGAKKEGIYTFPFTSLKNEDILVDSISRKEKNKLKIKLGIKEEKIIISVGRFVYGKGFDVLLEACTKIPKNYGVYIIGGLPTQEYIDIKNKLNLTNVNFIGFKSKEELKEYYTASDLFVLPTRSDVWGLVVNEAMACGLPVITTDKCVAGIELVNDYENGFIIPVDDVSMLAKKIIIILNDDELRKSMEMKSLEIVKTYTLENMAETHLDIFNTFLSLRKNNS